MSTSNQPVIGTIVFSLAGDAVWGSWPGGSMKLGQCQDVTFMMRDFLAQVDLGERLNRRKVAND